MKNGQQTNSGYYLINLYKSRSITALAAGVLVLCVTFSAVVMGIRSFKPEDESIFHYFTVLSNLFSAVGASFMIPYAVEGIRQKRFVLPRWVVLFQYCGACGVAITMVSTLLLILPTQGADALTGMNFWLHLITPTLTVILFQCVETGVSLTRKDTFIVLIPYFAYMAIYYVMVIIIGQDRGGWTDFYSTQTYWPAWVSVLLMLFLGYVVARLLCLVQNRRAAQSRKRLSRLWSDDLDPVELKIEVFGLGRYMGQHCDSNAMNIPFDIFMMMSERYGVPVFDLAKIYAKGVSDSLEEEKLK